MQKRYFRRTEAAKFITETWSVPCSPSYLAKLAVVGGGPTFRRLGRFPIYELSDLTAWIDSRTSKPVLTTSELEKSFKNN